MVGSVAMRQPTGMVCFTFCLSILFFHLCTASASDKCESLQVCNKVEPGKLNIHLLPHTHDDAGWLKTVDQYYYGSNKGHAPSGVKYIIDSVISELERDKTRRFVYAESSFLWRWWSEENEAGRKRLKRLVEDGQLQLIHGGWVMSDEAVTHYSALIDQMSFGLRFIDRTFGKCARPKTAWQIDTFGHSSEVAQEFIEMGYRGLFVGRIDLQDLFKRKATSNMETVWRPYAGRNIPDGNDELFTSVLYNLYMPPDGFCFDVFCRDDPIIDNPNRHGYNIDKVDIFVYMAKMWARAYSTNNVLITMGGDFNYMVAGPWFDNMDKIIKYGNQKHTDVNILYSTPDCYMEAVNRANATLTVKDDEDFFPYSSYDGRYWSGYYTSRPTLKYMAYRANNLLQVAKKMGAAVGEEVQELIFKMEEALGIVQHHDAITGTAKQHVTDDYALYLQEAFDAGQRVFTAAYRRWLGPSYPEQEFCLLTNISVCGISETADNFVVNLFNPNSHRVSVPVRLPVSFAEYKVTSVEGPVESELFVLPERIWSLPGRYSSNKHDIAFIAENIPAIGFKTFFLQKTGNGNFSCQGCQETKFVIKENKIVVPNGQDMQLFLNATNGQLQYVMLNGEILLLEQNFMVYLGDYRKPDLKGGAYTFSANDHSPQTVSHRATIKIYEGSLMTEIHQTFNSWVSQVIRVYRGSKRIEFKWLIGPIIIPQGMASADVITQYRTELKNERTFYTDSNGRRLMKRTRKGVTMRQDTISGNYYPVTSTAIIADPTARLTVLTDRPQGASSTRDGSIEFMLHRRLLTDDGKGVEEPLNERAYGRGLIAFGTHTVYFERKSPGDQDKTEMNLRRIEANRIAFAPWMSIFRFESLKNYMDYYQMELKPILQLELPESVNILTLEYRGTQQMLMRIEHLMEFNNESSITHAIEVSMNKLFNGVVIKQIEEMTLDGNQKKDFVEQLQWRHKGHINERNNLETDNTTSLSFIIYPMQIRTFLLTLFYEHM